MKDINDCVSIEEVDAEFIAGQARLRELLTRLALRQQQGDNRVSYTGVKELIDALEVNEFILDNVEGFRAV